jgi:hypothetical protein
MPVYSPGSDLPGPPDTLLPALIEDLLARGAQLRLVVGGVSMAPQLRDHDCVLIEALQGKDARFGDLVLFRTAGGTLVLHRVIRRWRDGGRRHRLQTRGDACVRLDGIIDATRVLGRVRRIERRGGGNIDLDTAVQRFRAVAAATGKLIQSAFYYKLGPTYKGSRRKNYLSPLSKKKHTGALSSAQHD